MARHDLIRAIFQGEPLPIYQPKLDAIVSFLEARLDGLETAYEPSEEEQARRKPTDPTYYVMDPNAAAGVVALEGPPTSGAGAVAVIPVQGVLNQRASAMAESSGVVSTRRISAQFNEALANPSVKTIIFDIESPGGSAYGIQELADEIHGARGRGKNLIAVANSYAHSAGYWIASQLQEFIVTPGGAVGSIGVLAVHRDFSGALEQAGIATTYVTAGKNKAEAAPEFPLTESAREHIQEIVDACYQTFLAHVARGRGVSVETVRRNYGEGRIFDAKAALRLGMVDRIDTLDHTIARFAAGGRVRSRGATAYANGELVAQGAGVELEEADEDAEISGDGSGTALPPVAEDEPTAQELAAIDADHAELEAALANLP